MNLLRRQILLQAFSLFDLGLLTVALYAAVYWRSLSASLAEVTHRTFQIHTIAGFGVLFILWRATLISLGLYNSKRLDPRFAEILDILKSSVASAILLALIGLIAGMRSVSNPAVILRFLCFATALLVVSRLILRTSLKIVRLRGRNLRSVLVVGTNSRAIAFADSIAEKHELGYRIAGFVDDRWIGPHSRFTSSAQLVSDLEGFGSYIRSHVVDEVVIALPMKSFYDHADRVLQLAREHGIIARVLTHMFEAPTGETQITHVGSDPVISFFTVPTGGLVLGTKRLIDIAVSLFIILLLAPFLLLIMALIKLDSSGPALFAQERVGLNKRLFRIYKFRTMVMNAETLQSGLESHNETGGPTFKIRNDPRITRLGKVLRKTSIDELPQLFNVLKGEMSLVGPRPLPVRDYKGFSEDWYRRRFSVRPGITCLWQISGRSGITFDQWMLLDIEYIDRWSLWLDLKILARTIPAVLTGSGAA
jgi:exopolysaccharide biosynthesis polyprenyl glycosylphosphotransferase